MTTNAHSKEEELAHLDEVEIRGAWKCLCASMLFHAARRATRPGFSWIKRSTPQSPLQAEIEDNRAVAIEWLQGGSGVVTYEECCVALGYEAEALTEAIERARKAQCQVTRRLG